MEVWTVLLNVVFGWVLGFTSAYFAAKGKNLATREDIGKIEREVQRVRDEFARTRVERAHENRLMLRRLGLRHQLRVAALERRLQAHQEAAVRRSTQRWLGAGVSRPRFGGGSHLRAAPGEEGRHHFVAASAGIPVTDRRRPLADRPRAQLLIPMARSC